ncbi:MAG: hypothetical protein GY821_08075, partial [Gammaproteobacteria bacterium]|nr:hypothetical protein [Gammaproteobacteria bacterium]
HPLPRIDDCLEKIGLSLGKNNKQYTSRPCVSTFDLKMGYHQLRIKEQDAHKTAFRTHRGLYEYTRLPMGLKTAGSFFQKLMNKVFNGVLDDGIFCYLDDICIATSTFEEHLEKLRLMLTRLREALLKLKPKKCVLLSENTKYLGHIVSREGLIPDPKKIDGIQSYPAPKTPTEVRRFLGMASYYRRFVPFFSKIAHPMRALTEKDQIFDWTVECQEAFDMLKKKLTEPPVLHYPDVTMGTYYIETDGSARGLGAVLCQKDQKGQLRPIAFASSGLSRTQQSYIPTELEALACVYAVRHFHTYIFGCTVTLLTDHASLCFLMKQAQPIPRLQRWILTLDQYNIKWVYRKGSSNAVADALSRRYESAAESEAAQSELISLDSLFEYTPKGTLYSWLLAVSTRATNRDEEKSVLDRKNPRESRKEKNWQNKGHPVNTWRENGANLVR